MQNTSELYKSIISGLNHRKVVRVDINGVTYNEGDIISCEPTFNMFTENALGVGGVCSSKLDLTVIPRGETIPRMALVEPYAAVTDGTRTSEYLAQGKFFIYQRKLDEKTGQLSIIAYDAMLKAEQTAYSSATGFPMTMSDMVSDFCTRMGVTLDAGTTISSVMKCEFDSTFTIRDYLSFIAIAHAANWTITEEGKLKLVDVFVTDDLLIDHEGNVILFGGTGIYV